jgi:hypothetical protein
MAEMTGMLLPVAASRKGFTRRYGRGGACKAPERSGEVCTHWAADGRRSGPISRKKVSRPECIRTRRCAVGKPFTSQDQHGGSPRADRPICCLFDGNSFWG